MADLWWVRPRYGPTPKVAHTVHADRILRLEARLVAPKDSAHQGHQGPLLSAACGSLIDPAATDVATSPEGLPDGWVPCLVCAKEIDQEIELQA